MIIEETGGLESELLKDGSEIQRVIAERHGRQRAALGWSEAQYRREGEILLEEVNAVMRRRVPEGVGDVSTALHVLRRLIECATAAGARALHRAVQRDSASEPA